jgi:hypothetical protein
MCILILIKNKKLKTWGGSWPCPALKGLRPSVAFIDFGLYCLKKYHHLLLATESMWVRGLFPYWRSVHSYRLSITYLEVGIFYCPTRFRVDVLGGVRFKNMCLDAFNLSKNKLICTYGKKKIIPFSVISFTIDNPFERFLSLSRY